MTVETEMVWVLIVALIGALLALVGGVTMLARALNKSSETNIKLNDEIQQNSKDRQAMQLELVKMEAEIISVRNGANENAERLERQISGLLSQVAQIRTQRDRMQGEVNTMGRKVDRVETENKDLRQKMTALETENKELRGEREVLIRKVDNLQRQLEAEITSNNELRAALETVRTKIKDLPSTDELSQEAAKIAADKLCPDDDPEPDPPGPKGPALKGGAEDNKPNEETTDTALDDAA